MCQLLEVKRSSYYHWAKKKKDDDIYPLHSEMLHWVKKIAMGVENLYGSRRMKGAMNCLGLPLAAKKRVG
jgi:putative transposase